MIFDTETTGLPLVKYPKINDTFNWPHVIQLSYILFNTETNSILLFKNSYIKISKDIKIQEGAYKVHGITHSFLNDNGIHVKSALYEFRKNLDLCKIIIGHNISFDKNIMMVEFNRNNIMHHFYNSKIYFCTMKANVDFCNIITTSKFNDKLYKKFPTLMELFKKLFPNETPENLHDSFVDILLTLRCYYKTKFNADLYHINRRYKNLYDKNCICSH